MSISALWILFPLLILTLEILTWKFLLVNFQKPVKKRSWEDAARKFPNLDRASLLLFFVLAICLTFAWHWFLVQITHKVPIGINGIFYVDYPSNLFLYLPAIFAAIITTPLPMYLLLKIAYRSVFRQYCENISRRVTLIGWKEVRSWLVGLYLAGVILIFLGASWYTAFTEKAIVVDRIWSPTWIVYSYSQVDHVRLIAYPMDDKTNFFYCEVEFLNGDLVRTEGVSRDRLPQYDSLAEFVADKANQPVEKEYRANKYY
jgi:hypothetical protein